MTSLWGGLGRNMNNQRTFRPKRTAPIGSKGAQLKKKIDATLGSGNLRDAVRDVPLQGLSWCQLPQRRPALPTVDILSRAAGPASSWRGPQRVVSAASSPERRREPPPARGEPPERPPCPHRLAVNTVDFFNAISLLYGTLTEFCSAETCPIMCAGPKYEYRWADGVKVKKPIECSAPDYVLYLMEWVESQLDDPKARLLVPGATCLHASQRREPLTSSLCLSA